MSVAQRADAVIAVDPQPRTKKRKIGPLLPIASLVITWAILGGFLAAKGFEVMSFIEALRILTKVSFLVFMLAFVARPLHDLFGNKTTAWLFANRRYIGLSFAAWHLIHWPILGGIMYILGAKTWWEWFGDFAIPAGSVLIVISILAATSNNLSQRLLGKTGWRVLHTVGVYVIWGWFFKVYVLSKMPNIQHVGDKPYVFVYVAIMYAGMLLRLAMAARRLAKH
jgi:DMSO/TMAO reductase YedYZ heme-binding membrane subunit